MTVLLPGNHTFLLSRQLLFRQTNRSRSFGFQILGGSGSSSDSRGGGSGSSELARPVLRLRDGSDVAGNVFVLFELDQAGPLASHDESEHYNSRIRGIDLDLGRNPAVSGLCMSGAQLCSIEDVAISGASFYAGVNGLPGSGGFSANVRVIGGTYGVVQNQFRPNPSISGLVLLGQQKAGLVVKVSRGPVVVSGFRIESAPDPKPGYRAVLLLNATRGKDNAFNGEDGEIFVHAGQRQPTGNGAIATTAIETHGSDVVLKNVSVAGVELVVNCPEVAAASLSSNASTPKEWLNVPLFLLTVSGGQVYDRQAEKGGSSANVSHGHNVTAYLAFPIRRGILPPSGLGGGAMPEMHSWDPAVLPHWDDGRVSNVAADYGATPQWVNATDDDGACIQQALNDACDPTSVRFGYTVFIPHGEFNLAQPLDLHGCAHLIGAGTHSTVLQALRAAHGTYRCGISDSRGQSGALLVSTPAPAAVAAGWEGPSPSGMRLVSDIMLVAPSMCRFIDLSAGSFLLRDVGVSLSTTAPPPQIASIRNTYAESNNAQPTPAPGPKLPYVALRGAAYGRFYGLPLDAIFGGKGADIGGPLHVLLLINGTGGIGAGPIHVYQPSTEHLVNDQQVLVAYSRNVHFHAWKYESSLNEPRGGPTDSGSLVRVQGSANVSLFGGSGNYRLYNLSVPMIDIEGSSDISVLGMVRKAAFNEPKAGLQWLRDTNTTLAGYYPVLLYNTAVR